MPVFLFFGTQPGRTASDSAATLMPWLGVQPSNLLLNSECSVKLADFGLARSVTQLQNDQGATVYLTDYVATRWYRAPEILLGSPKYTFGVDMWSSGMVPLLHSSPPYSKRDVRSSVHSGMRPCVAFIVRCACHL